MWTKYFGLFGQTDIFIYSELKLSKLVLRPEGLNRPNSIYIYTLPFYL